MSGRSSAPANRAARTLAATLGALVGVAGIEHGVLEMLQGNVAPGDLAIDAIGPDQRLWEYASESAFTIIPSYLVTGVLAVSVGLVVAVWATRFVDAPHGASVLLAMCIGLFLVGGGYPTIVFGVPASLVATRIRSPLGWWQQRVGRAWHRRLAALWPGVLVAVVVAFVVAVEIAVFGAPLLWFVGAEAAYGVQWTLAFVMLAGVGLAIPSAFAHDVLARGDVGAAAA